MNIHHIIIHLLVSLIFMGSCQVQTTTPDVEGAISQAGDNRKELFRIIQYYQNSGDSLKLKAALFLIGNMTDKYYLSGNVVEEYYSFIDSIYQVKQREYNIPKIHSEFRRNAKNLEEQPIMNWDTQMLSADYLISNIEEAFAVWNKPWNEHLNFNDFCELILPYRVGTEIAESWRLLYQERFERLLQSDSIQTAKQACEVINSELIKLPIHIAVTSALSINLRPTTLANIKFGLCGDYASLAVYAMRALGIPVAVEFVPHWGRGNGSHVFNVVYDNDKSSHDFSGAEDSPDQHLIRFKHEIPKVYRRTFGKQKNSLAMLHDNEEIPSFFKSAYMIDVTENYPFIGVKDVTIPLSSIPNRKFAYLCVFNPNGWSPIAWGNIVEKNAQFQDIGPNIVYHTALYVDGKLKLVGDPFLLDTLGKISYYKPMIEKMDYILERKNPKPKNLDYLPPLMQGCRFQGADNLEFQNVETFHTITEEPNFKYTTVECSSNMPVKYVRYLASDKTWGNMAEVEFYTDGSEVPLKGKVISDYEPSSYYPDNGVEMIFDGDALTFFHSQDTLSWGGLELEQPVTISKIRYIIRNDDNGIRKGHEYELFYMNQGDWKSLGKQVATEDDKLLYQEIPKGALYWLHDYTKGREERIFGIKNNKVIWH